LLLQAEVEAGVDITPVVVEQAVLSMMLTILSLRELYMTPQLEPVVTVASLEQTATTV
jgi:hypothetical protein